MNMKSKIRVLVWTLVLSFMCAQSGWAALPGGQERMPELSESARAVLNMLVRNGIIDPVNLDGQTWEEVFSSDTADEFTLTTVRVVGKLIFGQFLPTKQSAEGITFDRITKDETTFNQDTTLSLIHI